MRYFYIEPTTISGNLALIGGSDEKHIKKVLRLKPGDEVGLFDGKGFEYRARIERFSSAGVEVLILEQAKSIHESPVEIALAQGFLKERKMDDLVRHLTELGVSRYIPFIAARSVSRPGKKQLAQRMERWVTISKEALKQCRRSRFMEISEILSFTEALEAALPFEVKLLFWENESTRLCEIPECVGSGPVHSVFVMIGPEGGFTEEEVALARDSGFVTAGLGPRILRAETATLAAGALAQYLFGDMGKKTLDIRIRFL